MAFWSSVVKFGSKPAVFVPPPEGWTLHLSQASLPATVAEGKRVSVVHKAGEEDASPVVICTLVAGRQDSVPLDLFLDAYAEFSLVGAAGALSGVEVHLTGYYSPGDEAGGPGDSDEDEDFEPQMGEDDDEEGFPGQIGQLNDGMFINGGSDSDEGDEDDEGEDDDEDEDGEDEPGVTRRPHVTIEEIAEEIAVAKPTGKQPNGKAAAAKESKKDAPAAKAPSQTPTQKGKAAEQPVSGSKRPAEQPAAAKQEQPASKKQQAEESKGSKKNIRTWENGFSIQDVSMGPPNGKLAKKGKRVQMAYVGRLKSNGKVFDASKDKPFQFRLGVGEVIKGWDLGVEGMRVGDKRKLIIPPQLGYGSSGVRGSIPPNATLEFDVELLDVK